MVSVLSSLAESALHQSPSQNFLYPNTRVRQEELIILWAFMCYGGIKVLFGHILRISLIGICHTTMDNPFPSCLSAFLQLNSQRRTTVWLKAMFLSFCYPMEAFHLHHSFFSLFLPSLCSCLCMHKGKRMALSFCQLFVCVFRGTYYFSVIYHSLDMRSFFFCSREWFIVQLFSSHIDVNLYLLYFNTFRIWKQSVIVLRMLYWALEMLLFMTRWVYEMHYRQQDLSRELATSCVCQDPRLCWR